MFKIIHKLFVIVIIAVVTVHANNLITGNINKDYYVNDNTKALITRGEMNIIPVTSVSTQGWVKIDNWELYENNTKNISLYNMLRTEKLEDCFKNIQKKDDTNYDLIIDFICFTKDEMFNFTEITCIALSIGYICM